MQFTGPVGAVLYRLRCRSRSRWRSTVVLAAIVAVMGGIVLTLTAGAVRTLSAPDRYSDSRGDLYDATVEQLQGRPRTAEVLALPAVDRVDPVTFVFGGITPLDDPSSPYEAFVFTGIQLAFGTLVVDGREPEATDEFLATRSWVEQAEARLGDQFTLLTIRQEVADEYGFDAPEADGPTETATLVGVIDGPSQLDEPTPYAMFPPSMLDLGDVGVASTHSAITLAPGATVDDLREQLDGLPDGQGFSITEAEWVSSDVRAAVNAQGRGLAVVTAIAAAATIVVMGQLLSRQVRLGEDERRVLTSIGMTRRQIVVDQLIAAAVPVVVGSAAAVGLSWLASDVFPYGFVTRVEPHPGRRFEWLVHVPTAVGLALFVIAWAFVALVLGARGRRRVATPGVVDAVAVRVPSQAATALRFAFTRHARDATGPRGPIVGMVVVLAVLVGALTFGASLGEMVDHPAFWGGNFDLQIGQGGDALPDDAVPALGADPDVSAFSLLATITVAVGSAGFYLTAVEPVRGSITPVVLDGRLPRGTDEVAIGRTAARDLGLDVGDGLVVNGGARTLTITGLAVVPNVEGADGVGEGGLATLDALREIDPSATPTGAAIRLQPGASRDAFADRFHETTQMTAERPSRPGVIANVARVRSIPYLVAATLAALALLSLAHQLILSTQRRRHDLAVLRALGADSRWVTGVVHWHATAFTGLVLAIGTPLGIVAGRVVYHAFVDRIGARNTVTTPLAVFALAVVALLALANVVAAPNARRVRRRPPAGSLTAE
jgi:hypothetical protein